MNINSNLGSKRIFSYILMSVLILSLSLNFVSSADEGSLTGTIKNTYGWVWDQITVKFPGHNFLGQGVNLDGRIGFIIGLIGLIIIGFILYDIISFVPIFNETTTKVITVGMMIIIFSMGLTNQVVRWGVVVTANVFGAGSLLGLIGSSIVFLMVLFFLFFGTSRLGDYLKNMKANRLGLEKVRSAKTRGTAIKALGEMADEATSD